MTKTIVIAGKSTLAWSIAKLLDKTLAHLVHYEVIYITPDEDLIYPGDLDSILSFRKQVPISSTLSHIYPLREEVKSINTKEGRLITNKNQFDYDALLVDFAPTLTSSDLKLAKATLHDVISNANNTVRLGKKDRYLVYCPGQSVWSWQLALAILNDCRLVLKDNARSYVQVLVDKPTLDSKLAAFLIKNGLKMDKKLIHMSEHVVTMPEPSPIIKPTEVKNMKLDKRNQPMTDAYGRPQHVENMIVVANDRNYNNLIYRDQILSQRACVNLVNNLEVTKDYLSIANFDPSFLLIGPISSYYYFANKEGDGMFANVVRLSDRMFWNKASKPPTS